MNHRTIAGLFVVGFALSFPGAQSRADDDAPPPTPSSISPAAKEVLDRAVGAMGGQPALDAVTSVQFNCTMVGSQGTLAIKVAATNNSGVQLEQTQTPPDGGDATQHMMLTTNLALGWARDLQAEGVQIMPPNVTASVARAGDLWNMIRSGLGQFSHIEHDGSAVFAGRSCSRLKFSEPRSQGLQSALMYFDDETGLPLGQETSTASETLISGVARIDEWQTVGTLMVPKRIAVEGSTGSSTLTFDQVTFNAVAADAFAVPADVLQLAAMAAAGSM